MRAKSKAFPTINLGDCVKIITAASKSGNEITLSQLASFKIDNRGRKSSDDVASVKSGAFLTKLASLKSFGLIEKISADKVRFTAIANKIVYPENETDKSSALIEAFLKPKLFSEIYTPASHQVPLEKTRHIGNKAISLGVVAGKREKFIKSFVESGVYANLIEVNDKDSITFTHDDGAPDSDSQGIRSAASADPLNFEAPQRSNKEYFDLSFPGGVQLRIPSSDVTSRMIAMGEVKPIAEAIQSFTNKLEEEEKNNIDSAIDSAEEDKISERP